MCICEHVCILEFHFHLFFLCVTEHGIACFHIYLCEQVCVHTGSQDGFSHAVVF